VGAWEPDAGSEAIIDMVTDGESTFGVAASPEMGAVSVSLDELWARLAASRRCCSSCSTNESRIASMTMSSSRS